MLACSFSMLTKRIEKKINVFPFFYFYFCAFSFIHASLKLDLKDLKEDINKPYSDLHPVLRVLSWLLMR